MENFRHGMLLLGLEIGRSVTASHLMVAIVVIINVCSPPSLPPMALLTLSPSAAETAALDRDPGAATAPVSATNHRAALYYSK
jgi:hypothetical protein